MIELSLISAALGLSALSGLSLYLTVFIVSLSIHTGWIHLAPGLDHLQTLGHPAILILSGVLAVVEFVADKWPWFDSLWDTVHTVIRPVGAAFMGVVTLGIGNYSTTTLVIACLLCGAFSLTTHSSKAGLRLLVNTSPEPVSNSVVSLGENALVIGGTWLTCVHPIAMLVVLVVFLILFIWLAPKIFRHIFHTARFIILKLKTIVVDPEQIVTLPIILNHDARVQFEKTLGKEETVEWSVPVITGKIPKLPRNQRAYLAHLQPTRRLAVIVSGKKPLLFDTDNMIVTGEAKMLYNQLCFQDSARKRKYNLRFAKNHHAYYDTIKALFNKPAATPQSV